MSVELWKLTALLLAAACFLSLVTTIFWFAEGMEERKWRYIGDNGRWCFQNMRKNLMVWAITSFSLYAIWRWIL